MVSEKTLRTLDFSRKETRLICSRKNLFTLSEILGDKIHATQRILLVGLLIVLIFDSVQLQHYLFKI